MSRADEFLGALHRQSSNNVDRKSVQKLNKKRGPGGRRDYKNVSAKKHGKLNRKLNKLGSLDVQILLSVGQGFHSNKELSKHLRMSKSKVSYHTTKLVKSKFMRREDKGIITDFFLTTKGKKYCSSFLALSEGEWLKHIRNHRLRYISRIVRKPRDLDGKLLESDWTEFYPRNWTGYKKNLFDCIIIFTPNTVQYHLPDIYSTSEDVGDKELELILEVKTHLEQEYSIVLGKPEELARVVSQHRALQYDPLAIEYWKHNVVNGTTLTYKSDRLEEDFSDGVPETETVHKAYAREDLLKLTGFYEDVIRKDWSIREQLEFQEKLNRNLSKIVEKQDKVEGALGGVSVATLVNDIGLRLSRLEKENLALRKRLSGRGQSLLSRFMGALK